MTDSRWMDEWMRAWQSFPGGSQTNPWSAALDYFTKANRDAYQQPFADALNKITEQSRAFFDLGQTVARSGGDDWQQAVFEYLDELSSQAQDPETAAKALAGVSPLDYWKQVAGHDAADHQSFTARIDKLLQMPGVGYTREHQEAVQELSRRWLHHEKAYGEYAAYCAETARRAVERLRERFQDEFARGKGPATIRGLYDAWVACNEEVYAERAATDEYLKLHGRMVNTLMSYRQQAGRLVDQWAGKANLPTREEVDALHRKLKDTRQEMRALQARLDDKPPVKKKQKKKRKKKRKKK